MGKEDKIAKKVFSARDKEKNEERNFELLLEIEKLGYIPKNDIDFESDIIGKDIEIKPVRVRLSGEGGTEGEVLGQPKRDTR